IPRWDIVAGQEPVFAFLSFFSAPTRPPNSFAKKEAWKIEKPSAQSSVARPVMSLETKSALLNSQHSQMIAQQRPRGIGIHDVGAEIVQRIATNVPSSLSIFGLY
ncbi:hypothetical protein H0E87_024583, partial [Populus deltoides]